MTLQADATMQAVVHDAYVPLDALELQTIARPRPGVSDVLIRVHAAALHIGDAFAVRGKPLPIRLATGLFRPTSRVPGFDVSGVVEEVGASVTRFAPGDAVFGASSGTCAEYTLAPETRLAPKPGNLTFEQAAAVPTSGLAALHALRDAAGLQRGQTVLINGAAGGVGTFAVQIAKAMGAHVTGVCGTANVELVRSLGAEAVIDYTRNDFTRGHSFDVVFDNVENRSLSEVRRALTSRGTLVLNSGSEGKDGPLLLTLSRLVWPLALSPFVRHNLRRYLSVPNTADLAVLTELLEWGAIKPVIDRTFALRDTAEALRHIETGHARGKVVIKIV